MQHAGGYQRIRRNAKPNLYVAFLTIGMREMKLIDDAGNTTYMAIHSSEEVSPLRIAEIS